MRYAKGLVGRVSCVDSVRWVLLVVQTEGGSAPVSYGEERAEAHEAGDMPEFARRRSEGPTEAHSSTARSDYSWR